MREYLWETQLHTAETSRCAVDSAVDMVRRYHDLGYAGLVVTDHLLNHSCRDSRRAPWEKRVDTMLKGYQAALQAGEPLGLTVLLGWEHTDQGADYLTYGVPEEFLRDQPKVNELPIEEYILRVHSTGGFVSQAHPFRAAWYMPADVPKRWDLVDAIEVINGSHTRKELAWDDQALALAEAHDLPRTAGSDAHDLAGAATAAMAFDTPIRTDDEFIAALRAREGRAMRR